MTEEKNENLRELVAEVAAAYFANSHVGVGEIGAVIDQIARSLGSVGEQPRAAAPAQEQADTVRRLTPAQIRRSVTPDALISFEDGKPYRTLRRHLATKGLTPEQYREKWGLASDYPMVAASYSAARSRMAKELGLGNRRSAAAASSTRSRRRNSPAASE